MTYNYIKRYLVNKIKINTLVLHLATLFFYDSDRFKQFGVSVLQDLLVDITLVIKEIKLLRE